MTDESLFAQALAIPDDLSLVASFFAFDPGVAGVFVAAACDGTA